MTTVQSLSRLTSQKRVGGVTPNNFIINLFLTYRDKLKLFLFVHKHIGDFYKAIVFQGFVYTLGFLALRMFQSYTNVNIHNKTNTRKFNFKSWPIIRNVCPRRKNIIRTHISFRSVTGLLHYSNLLG